jgi:Flp pilus assembly pilin Flp
MAARPRHTFRGVRLSLHHAHQANGALTTFRKARREVDPFLRLFSFARAHTAAAVEPWKRDEGQTMAEYGVALAIITIAVITAISLLSGKVVDTINAVADALPGT